MSTALTLAQPTEVIPIQEALSVYRPPDLVLAEAHSAAAALKKVIESKPKKVTFNGEQYLEFEDWQTLGRFYGITSIVRCTKYVEYGEVKGFEATAEALLVATNQVISSADAMCLNDEANWGTRAKYEWVDILDADGKKIWNKKLFGGKGGYERERKQVGEEQVPLFQLRSMAQTRACAKAMRNVLAWVVVLAGYKPTPAEELPVIEVPTVEQLKRGAAEYEAQHADKLAQFEEPSAHPAEATALGLWPTTVEGNQLKCYVLSVNKNPANFGKVVLEVRHMGRDGKTEVGTRTGFLKPDSDLFSMIENCAQHNCTFRLEKSADKKNPQKSYLNIVELLACESPEAKAPEVPFQADDNDIPF